MLFYFLFTIINRVLSPVWLFNVYDVITIENEMTLTETATLPVATLTVEDVPFPV